MNSLALTQRFVRVLVSLAAVTSLFFTAGCGSSAPAKSNPVGFSASSLSGTYVFSTSGRRLNEWRFPSHDGSLYSQWNGRHHWRNHGCC